MENKLKKRAHLLELVSKVGRLINRELETDELLLTTVSSISKILGYYNNSIWFTDGNSLILKAYSFSSAKTAKDKITKIINILKLNHSLKIRNKLSQIICKLEIFKFF